MQATPILQACGLRYGYEEGRNALNDLSLDLFAGERVALLGPNGAGKSTLFLTLAGVLAPAAGEVRLEGRCMAGRARAQLCESVGLVFQNADDQIIAPTVATEVSFGPMNLCLPEEQVRARVEHALSFLDLQDFRARAPHALSGGEKKRVTIADLLAMRSRVLLLDEPAASLDPAGAQQLEAVLARLHQEGHTLVIATHDMDFALRWADRVVVMQAGRVLADGAPAAVLTRSDVLAQAHLQPPLLVQVYEMLRARGIVPPQAACPRSSDALERLLDEK